MTWRQLLGSKGFLFFLLVCFALFSYFFVRELNRRYQIEREIKALENEILQLEKDNEQLVSMIEYFKTQSFQEREIRQKLNLQKPGEHVVVLPNFSTPTSTAFSQASSSKQDKKNWQLWWEYFFGE